jgi:hypothetical protein
MSATKVYDPASVLMSFAGIPIRGFADGTMVNIEFNEDAFSLQMGTDGEGTRSKTNNRSAKVTISLMQSSDTNDLLSGVHTLDLNSPGGDGVGPLLIKDGQGRSLFLAEKAWIMKSPGAEYGREATAREWVFEMSELIAVYGGN